MTWERRFQQVTTRIGSELKFENVELEIFNHEKKSNAKIESLENCEVQPGTVNFINVVINETKLEWPVINMGNKPQMINKGDIFNDIMVVYEDDEIPTAKPKSKITRDNVNLDESLTNKQKEEVVTILNDFRDCIALNESELGCTNKIEMDIELKENAVPVQSKPYKMNRHDREALDKIVREYKKAGLVSETNSDFASPAFLIKKKTGI